MTTSHQIWMRGVAADRRTVEHDAGVALAEGDTRVHEVHEHGQRDRRGQAEQHGVVDDLAGRLDRAVARGQARRQHEPAFALVVQRFGPDVVQADGALDRARLGEIVFADAAARRDLERITHTRIIELMQERIAAALAGDAPLVVVDIPLLFENAREGLFEGVLLVYAPPQVQRQRLRERNGLDEESARRRLAAQLPIDRETRSRDVDHRQRRRSRRHPARRRRVVGAVSQSGGVRGLRARPSSRTSSIWFSSCAKAVASSRRSVPMTYPVSTISAAPNTT